MATSYSPKIVTDGILVLLDAGNIKSYISGSTTWYDLSTKNNTGTLISGSQFNSASNGSILFDGIEDYVSIPHNNQLNISSSMTLGCWVNLNSLPIDPSLGFSMIGKGSTSGSIGGYAFRIDGPTTGTYTINLVKYFLSDQRANLPSLNTNTWYNFVAVQTANDVKYYVNGIYVGQYNNSQTYQTNSINLSIGKDRTAEQFFPGRIAFVFMYNRELSANEVLQNFNATRGRFGV
jgi:hypothetical protein